MSDHNVTIRGSKYNKCLWDFIHIETGTQFLCGIALLLHVFAVIGFFLRTNESFFDYWDIVRLLLGIGAYILAFGGIHLVKPRFIIVCLIWLGCRIVYYSGAVFLTLASYFPDSPLGYFYQEVKPSFPTFGKSHIYNNSLSVTPERVLLRSVLMVLLYICIFDFVYKCYKYVAHEAVDEEDTLPKTIETSLSVTQQGNPQV
uniref:Uncharacterized protein n=1 Tax=Panagrolaimus davidi TaxID=227884 RepID=A0A914P9F4_9BILA